jgi:hypothetical protein
VPATARDKLERESRINYTKIYTVEHNVKVVFIGHVDPASQQRLANDFDSTWMKKRQMAVSHNYDNAMTAVLVKPST